MSSNAQRSATQTHPAFSIILLFISHLKNSFNDEFGEKSQV